MLFTSLFWLLLAVEPLPLGRDSRLWVLPDGDLVVDVGPMTHLTFLNLSDRIGCDRIDAALNHDGGPATGVTIPRYPAHQLPPLGPVADVWVLRSP